MSTPSENSKSAKTNEPASLDRILVAVVQIECHPALKIGDKDLIAEPYLNEAMNPPLSRLARHGQEVFNVSDLQERCRREYLAWSRVRLEAVLAWLVGCSESAPHILVFPEGGVPRQDLSLLVDFAAKTGTVIFAGTHAFATDSEAAAEYERIGILPQGEFRIDDPARPFARRLAYLRLIAAAAHGGEVNAAARDAAEKMESDLASLLVGLEQLPTGKFDEKGSRALQEAFPKCPNLADIWKKFGWKLLERAGTKAELERIAAQGARASVLPIIDPGIADPDKLITDDGRKRLIRLRAKTALSPFERTDISSVTSEKAEVQSVHLRGHTKSISVLPLVCSEALQLAIPSAEYQMVVIVSNNKEIERFLPFVQIQVDNQRPVIYCNDGVYGDSTIRAPRDARSSSWWHSEPNQGLLPKGDNILVAELLLERNAPSAGVNNPQELTTLAKLASIIPSNPGHSPFRVATKLDGLRNEYVRDPFLSRSDLVRKLQNLRDLEDPTELQKLNINYLISLVEGQSIAYAKYWALHANDCYYPAKPSSLIHQAAPRERDDEGPQRGRSLEELRKELAIACYNRFVYFLDNRTLTNAQTKTLLEVRNECARRLFGNADHASVLGAAISQMRQLEREARDEARRNLTHRIGILAERFGATAGWLFVAGQADHAVTADRARTSDSPSELVAEIVHNAPRTRRLPRPRMTGVPLSNSEPAGITWRVWQAKKGYVVNGVVDDLGNALDPYNKQAISSTRSVLSVPIFDFSSTAKDVLAVCTLESRSETGFSPVCVGELQAAVAELAPDIQVLLVPKAIEEVRFGWHPSVHGWGLSYLLGQYCFAVSTGVPGTRQQPAAGVTIWLADRAKRRLYVRGTTRFDYEYIADRTLPFDSCTGSALNAKESSRVDPRSDPNFRRKRKADIMELKSVVLAPVARPSVDAIGVLSVYLFEHQHGAEDAKVQETFSETAVSRLATLAFDIVHSFWQLRRSIAFNYLRATLIEGAVPELSVFESMKDSLMEIFEADGCSILAVETDDGKRKLRTIATSGLVHAEVEKLGDSATSDQDLDDPWPEVNIGKWRCRVGLTRHLGIVGRGSAKLIRKLDVNDPGEVVRDGVGEDDAYYVSRMSVGAERQDGSTVESRVKRDMGHHRYLGFSVRFGEETLGVVTVVRSASSPPFLEADEVLMKHLAEVFVEAFLLRRHLMDERERFENEAQRIATNADRNYATKFVKEAALRLVRPARGFSDYSRKSVDSFLYDLLVMYEQQGALIASLRFVVADRNGGEALHLYALRAKWSRQPPNEEQSAPVRKSRGSIGWDAINEAQIITGKKSLVGEYWWQMHDYAGDTERTICLPFHTFANGHDTKGVLAIDFDDLDCSNQSKPEPRLTLTTAMMCDLVQISARLGWLASPNADFIGVPVPALHWEAVSDAILRLLVSPPFVEDAAVKPRLLPVSGGDYTEAKKWLGDDDRIKVAFAPSANRRSAYLGQLAAYGFYLATPGADDKWAKVVFPLYVGGQVAAIVCGAIERAFFDDIAAAQKGLGSSHRELTAKRRIRRKQGASLVEAVEKVCLRWTEFITSSQRGRAFDIHIASNGTQPEHLRTGLDVWKMRIEWNKRWLDGESG